MEFKNVKEALQLLLELNSKPESEATVIVEDETGKHVRKQTYSDLQHFNYEAVDWIADTLGIDVHDDETINGEQANQLIKKVQARVKKTLEELGNDYGLDPDIDD